jgi:EmrB/QacA subfamily drug resistance transporter
MTAPVSEQVRFGEPGGRWVLLATVLGSGLAMLDATVVNVALPRIGEGLNADLAGLQWTLNGYTLTLAAFILLGGSLADRLGRRRLFVIGTIWFAVASALCGLAPNIEFLIGARALQGIGGALLTPGSLAIISASFAPEDRGKAIGAWSGLGGLAGAAGPFVGGWLVQAYSWRLVFLVNLPLAAVVVLVALRHVPESVDPTATGKIDVPGAVLGALGLAGLTYASIAAGDRGADPVVLVSAALGVLALIAFVTTERRSAHPLVPLELFSSRQFTVANVVTFAIYAAFGAVFFLLVLNLQVVAGYSPLASGAALLPTTVLMLGLSSRSGALAARIGPRAQMCLGPVIAAAGLLLTLRIGPGASYLTDVLPGVLVFGLGITTLVAPLTATVLAAAPGQHAGAASGVNNAVARAAGLLAVALLPPLSGLTGNVYRQPAAFADGYRTSTLIAVGLLVVAGLLAGILISNTTARIDADKTGDVDTGPARTDRLPDVVHCFSCPVDGPRLETVRPRERQPS